jgi:hypothetical protein
MDGVVEFSQDDFVPEIHPVVVEESRSYIKSGLTPDELRKKIPEAYVNVRENYLDLCRYLLEVKVENLYKKWKYASFREYVHAELGIRYSKANYLSRLWLHFGKDPEFLLKVKDVGWDKMRELMRIINSENLDYWLSKAKMISADDLKKEVKAYLRSLVPDDPKKAIENEPQVENTIVAEQVKTITYDFLYENYLTVCTAIEKLQRDNPGMTPPEALALICAEFLGTAAGDSTGIEHVVGMIRRFEKLQPVECVVLEKETDQVVYGEQAFQRLIGSVLNP